MASAFDLLRARSRNTNTKLTELATHIVNDRVDLAVVAVTPPR